MLTDKMIKWYYKVSEGLGIIYLVTLWITICIVYSKNVHQSKQKPIIWSDTFHWKFEVFEVLACLRIAVLATYIIHLLLVFLYLYKYYIFKFCELEFVIACFLNNLTGIWPSRYFFCFLPSHHLNLREQPWRWK